MRRYYVYMLRCADGALYVGVTNDPERRLAEHNAGIDEDCYVFERRPVTLVYCAEFREVLDALAWEKRLKGWSREKKLALIRDDWPAIHAVVRNERKRREGRGPSTA